MGDRDRSSRRTQIAVCGAANADPEIAAAAERVGRGIAEGGATVVCGGGSGVMEAAARGAREAGGEVIGILRSTELGRANPHCTHVVATGIGQARNLAVVASADAVIAVGGEWGTLSEIAFARRIGRPVITLDSWTLTGRGAMTEPPGVTVAGDPAEAVRLALGAAGGDQIR